VVLTQYVAAHHYLHDREHYLLKNRLETTMEMKKRNSSVGVLNLPVEEAKGDVQGEPQSLPEQQPLLTPTSSQPNAALTTTDAPAVTTSSPSEAVAEQSPVTITASGEAVLRQRTSSMTSRCGESHEGGGGASVSSIGGDDAVSMAGMDEACKGKEPVKLKDTKNVLHNRSLSFLSEASVNLQMLSNWVTDTFNNAGLLDMQVGTVLSRDI